MVQYLAIYSSLLDKRAHIRTALSFPALVGFLFSRSKYGNMHVETLRKVLNAKKINSLGRLFLRSYHHWFRLHGIQPKRKHDLSLCRWRIWGSFSDQFDLDVF